MSYKQHTYSNIIDAHTNPSSISIFNSATTILLILVLAVAACAPLGETNKGDDSLGNTVLGVSGAWVRYVGDRRDILHRGDIAARIDLSLLSGIPHLYAIGPLEGLRGEITIYDGEPSISNVTDGQPSIDVSLNHRAPFLVYGSVRDWQSLKINKPIKGLDNVEAHIREFALASETDLDKPFLFRVEGYVDTLSYHIMDKTNAVLHNWEEHQRAKRIFAISSADVQIVGFWADAGLEGVYTHPGRRTHLHFRNSDNSTSGHVDDLVLRAGSMLFIPR